MEIFSLFGTLGMKGVKDAERDIDSVEGKASSTASKLGTVFKAGAAVAASAVVAMGTASVAAVIKSVKAAGELEQQLGGADAVFGKYADQIKKKGVEAYSKLGLSQSDYLATANKMGALFQGSGFTQQKSLELTSKAMQRASDVASIMGIDIKDAMESVTGAAKGNYTMMDNLGVGMNDTTLASYAMSKGISKSWKEMSQAEKVGVAMEMFLDKTSYAAGNYSKENATLAGSLDTAKAALSNFMSGAGSIDAVISSGMNFASIAGKSAMQMAPKILGGLASGIKQIVPKIPSIMNSLGDGIRDGLGAILEATLGKEVASKAAKAFDSIRQVATEVFDNLSNVFDSVSIVIGTVIDIIGKLWEGFNGGEASKQLVKGLGDTLKLLSDKLVEGVNAVGKFLTKLSDSGKVEQFGKFLKDVVKTLQNFAPVIVAVIAGFAGFMAVQKFFLLMAQGFVFINKVKTALTTAKTAMVGFNAVLAANPIGVIVGVIAALVAGLVYFFTQTETGRKAWQSFMDWLKQAWQAIAQFFSDLWDGIVDTFNTVVDSLKESWESVTSFFSGLWDDITNVFTTAVNSISNFVVPIFNAIASGIQIVMNIIWSIIQVVWQLVKVTIELVVGGIVAYIKWAAALWGSIITTAMNLIKNVITTVWNAISPFVTTVLNSIKNVITTVWNAISSVISNVMNGIRAFITPIWNSIKSTISTVVNAIKNVITSVFNSVKSSVTSIFNAIKNTLTSVWNSIKSATLSVVNSIKNTIVNTFNAIKGPVTSVFNAIKNTISSVWNSIKSTITSVVNSIKNTVVNTFNSVKSSVSSIFNAVKSTASSIWNGVKSTISSAVNGIKNTVSSVFSTIKSAMTGPVEAAKGVISGIIDNIKGFFNFKIKFPDISIPKIPMPHFKISGDFNPLKGKIPSVGVDWYAKGGIMTGATIFGMNGNNLQVGGEAGREAVLPLNKEVLGQIGDGIVKATDGGFGGGGDFNFYQTNYSPENIDARTAAKLAKREGKEMLRTARIRS